MCVCLSALDVVCYEFGDSCWYVCLREFVNESVYVIGVKCFAHVKCHSNGSLWWFALIEPCSDLVVEPV